MTDATPPPSYLVFTDLDGSLLDHHSYDWQPAAPWLMRLGEAGIPVIPVTSKTRSELLELRRELGLEKTPFIGENGAVIGLPPSWQHATLDRDPDDIEGLRIKTLGADINFLRQRLEVLREHLGCRFRCLSEMPLEEIVAETGLSEPAARRAVAREGSEPILWEDDARALDEFRAALKDDALTLTQGGRFHHVMGDVDKGRAIDWLVARFVALRGASPVTLGLGDGPNDVSLLQAVDRAVLIRGCHSHPVEVSHPSLYSTRRAGPHGWVEGIEHWLGETLA
ncbi:mannosyl-3-phosphoglycerate phosphatase [Modicisalibacter ilicicola DSM 19980]|uniref:Mannosyl-3-phosphoglycerate phosphatase n=1 Tax=Modicisalibacter ilicicola DSM 19980 TaxID=1121942 RepID=A0A1M4SWE8_9GAMM|nr:HAD-IIB family hydrolase [Halomonas ilicicola]SHE36499.1 mannosyl-3-phosphoglycerate phosphatase [Halomonas ilicicola DSM 19980]